MISVKVLGKQVEKLVVDNAPIILTAVGAVGSVSATYLTGRATVKAVALIEEEEKNRVMMNSSLRETEKLNVKEKMFLVWQEYLPAAGVLTLSVASIICANRVSTRRAAAMAAAYSLSEKAYSEYREKVADKFTQNKERQIRDEIAQDRVNGNPPDDRMVIITGNGDVMFLDKPTGRYFKSNIERIRTIQNDLNVNMIETGATTLGDLFAAIGMPPTPMAEEIGWTSDHPLEIHFSTTLTPDNQPCIVIDYSCKPIRGRFQGCIDEPSF